MKSVFLTFIALFVLTNLWAQQPYPHLEVFKIKNGYCGDVPNFEIFYDKTLGEVINKQRKMLPKDHVLFMTDDFQESDIVVLKLKFNSSNLNGNYYLVFSYGPSCDPNFYFVNAADGKAIGNTWGMNLYIPGGNSVYTTGHINTDFNKRRKYSFNGSKFEELKPEFYYVGLKTKTLKPMTLYSDEALTTKLANLPVEYAIEVLAAKRTENYSQPTKYLVKTSLGLVGWSIIKSGAFASEDVEGIMFLGD